MGWVEHKLKLNKAFLNPKSSKMNKISKKVKFLVQINEVLKGHFQNPKPDKFWKPNASLLEVSASEKNYISLAKNSRNMK